MDIIKSGDSRYTEYEDLLMERDRLLKESGQIWTVYQQLFGQLMTEIFEEKIEYIKNKKIIGYYQAALNHGGEIDSRAMQAWLDNEMAAYEAQLKKMIEETEEAKNAGTSTPYQVKRSKELYRRLAKLLHPDLNPLTDGNEDLQELWNRVVIAYGNNDVKELTELSVLIRKALKDLGAGETRAEIPDLEERIDALKEEIEGIKNTEPYTYKVLIGNSKLIEAKTKELQEELESCREYRKELGRIILQMLQGGDIRINVS